MDHPFFAINAQSVTTVSCDEYWQKQQLSYVAAQIGLSFIKDFGLKENFPKREAIPTKWGFIACAKDCSGAVKRMELPNYADSKSLSCSISSCIYWMLNSSEYLFSGRNSGSTNTDFYGRVNHTCHNRAGKRGQNKQPELTQCPSSYK